MKEQYIAEFQQKNHNPGKWQNAGFFTMNKRYFWTQAEAEEAIRKIKAAFPGKPQTSTQVCGSIGITIHEDSRTADDLMVVKSRIRVRLVTEWETITEE